MCQDFPWKYSLLLVCSGKIYQEPKLTNVPEYFDVCLVQGPRNGFHVIPQYWFKGHDFNTIPGWLILRGFTGAAQGTQGGKQVSRGPFSSSGWRTCVDFSYVMTTATVIQQDSFFKVFPSVVVSVFRCLCLNIGFSVFLYGRNSSMNALCLSHSLINSLTYNFTNDIQL